MAKITITNVGSSNLYLRDIYNDLDAGASIVIDRPASQIHQMTGLLEQQQAGTVTVDVSLSAAELASEQVLRPIVTVADKTLWVDGTTGDDTAAGTSTAPLKTINEALRRVPQAIAHNVTIKVAAGTYAESLNLSFTMKDPAKKLTIEGTTWTAVAPATGPATGTFTGFTDNAATLAAAGWTINDLRSKFLKVTSGALNGRYFPIVSNTATNIEVPFVATSLNGASFEIVTPAAIISGSATQAVMANSTGAYDLGSITLKSLKISTTLTYGVRVQSGCLSLDQVTVAGGAGTAYCVYTDGPNAVLTMKDTNTTAVNAWCAGVYASSAHRVSMSGVHIYGSDNTDASFSGVYLNSVRMLHIGDAMTSESSYWAVIENYGTGMLFDTCNTTALTNRFIVRSNNIGIQMKGSGIVLETDGMELRGNTTHGLKIHGNWGGGCMIDASGGFSASANGGDAIRMEGSHNKLVLGGTISITGNTGFGINLGASKEGSHNTVVFNGAATMNTNTAGDLTIDGTAVTAYADLTADADKTIVDALRFNRMITA